MESTEQIHPECKENAVKNKETTLCFPIPNLTRDFVWLVGIVDELVLRYTRHILPNHRIQPQIV